MNKKGVYRLFKLLLPHRSVAAEVTLDKPYCLENNEVRVRYQNTPLCIKLPKQGYEFHIYKEEFLDNAVTPSVTSYRLIDPERRRSGISGFIRLKKPGVRFVLGHKNGKDSVSCQLPENLEMRMLSILNDGEYLSFRKLVSDTEVEISRITAGNWAGESTQIRRDKLKRISDIYGGAIEMQPPPIALETLRAVNQLMEEEAHRPRDERGKPGGVLRLPGNMAPIIVGDLHAQVDNFLNLLTHNRFLDTMETGEAALIILGDAVHSEVEGQLDHMDDSLLMMDLIFRLKLRFPDQVFYIRGNHDSFSETQSKFGVTQCLFWEHALARTRGEAYLTEMRKYYEALPYVVISDDFVACHAAPIKTQFDMERLVNIHRYRGLVQQLTRNRIRRRNSPSGYTHHDVKHFRQILGVPDSTAFIVSHSPIDRDNAYWLDAGGIPDHHIVFSANLHKVGVFTRVAGKMIALSYYGEKLRHQI